MCRLFEWTLPDGTVWAKIVKNDTSYKVHFPDYAEFSVSLDGEQIDCSPKEGASDATLEHLYLNQVRPLALSLKGSRVFHGAAVRIPSGISVAFLGASGRGKSTLAAAFASRGLPFLTDDTLLVEELAGAYSVCPSHPSVRLYDDSQLALLGEVAPTADRVSYTSKNRVLSFERMQYATEPCPLHVAYLLGNEPVEIPEVKRITGPSAVKAWVSCTFLLDIQDPAVLRDHFGKVVELARSVPIFSLDYPRRFDEIDALIDYVLEHAGSLDP